MNYVDILNKLNAPQVARSFEKGNAYELNKRVTVDTIQIDWIAMCADINIGYFLCSIKQLDSNKSLLDNASMNIQLFDEYNKRFGGGGGGNRYFDAATGILYILNHLYDMSLLKPGRIRIRVDKLRTMPLVRIVSQLHAKWQKPPFYMPLSDNSILSISVGNVDFDNDSIKYTYTVNAQEKHVRGAAIGLIFAQSSDSKPSLYLSSLNKEDDIEYLNKSTVLSAEQNGNEYNFHCCLNTEELTQKEIDALYFVYNDVDFAQYDGEFGTSFVYQPDDRDKQYQVIDVDKTITCKNRKFTIKDVILGNICIRVSIEGSVFAIDEDLTDVIKLSNGQQELKMLGATTKNDLSIIDFEAADIDRELVLQFGDNSMLVMQSSNK